VKLSARCKSATPLTNVGYIRPMFRPIDEGGSPGADDNLAAGQSDVLAVRVADGARLCSLNQIPELSFQRGAILYNAGVVSLLLQGLSYVVHTRNLARFRQLKGAL
jgi:hypothetical protein